MNKQFVAGESGTQAAAAKMQRKRILIVNVFFDDYRRNHGSPAKILRAMAPAYLGGAFNPVLCEVKAYDEGVSGPLTDHRLLAWPDMVVFTGLTAGFDRMLHLTAYAKTLNPRVVTVAGGPAVRALYPLAKPVFDYASLGDIEDLAEIAKDAFGRPYGANRLVPRFDLIKMLGSSGYIESSRYCNFACSFCALTGEGRAYKKYDLDYIREQILALGPKNFLFIDNNFYGNDRTFFLDRLALLKDLKKEGRIKSFTALVTGDFFSNPENLALMREAGCISIFSGVESLDLATLKNYSKNQNLVVPQTEMITQCLEAGMAFTYGMIMDVMNRPIGALRQEIEYILSNPALSLPQFLTLPIPLPGTPYFHECADKGALLPGLRLRDLDGLSVVTKTHSPLDEVLQFVSRTSHMHGDRAKIARHGAQFMWKYRHALAKEPMAMALASGLFIAAPRWSSAPFRNGFGRYKRTHYGPTEDQGACYKPIMRVEDVYKPYFEPTKVTDAAGNLMEAFRRPQARTELATAPPVPATLANTI